MTPHLFDRQRIAHNLARRPEQRDDFVRALIHADLAERLSALNRAVERALAIGPAADLLPEHGASAKSRFDFIPALSLPEPVDNALVLPEGQFDLIVSILDLQAVDDVPGYLSQLARRLVPDGVLMAVALGGDTLGELRTAFLTADAELSGGAFSRVAPFIAVREAGGLLQRAGLALPVADLETHVVRYSDIVSLMREIKALGGSNPLSDRPSRLATPRLLLAAQAAYRDIAGDADGRIRATLDLIWLSGWAPHESQQKPLRPGSAKVSMADMLKSRE